LGHEPTFRGQDRTAERRNHHPPLSACLSATADGAGELRPDAAVVTSSHWHYHGDELKAELVIPSTGKPLPSKWAHKPEHMQRHIEKVHGGVNDQTVHLDENRAKYVFPPGDGAKRLDMHPEAWTRFTNASRVFFVIEGCIKADAVLSAGEAVFSVPSVTLWAAPELTSFARTLRGKVVYIIPDADWITNGNVITQAIFCRTYLRRLGITQTHVGAPPYDRYQANDKLKGIDDHLAYGGSMDDLDVTARETPYGLAEYLAERRTWRRDRVVRNAEVLEGLALHADSNGQVWASLRAVARIMGIHHSRVERAVRDLEWCGAIHVDGDLSTRPRHCDPKMGWVGWDWNDRPTITIVPELRAKDSFRRLSD
jgi:hypothetical protein